MLTTCRAKHQCVRQPQNGWWPVVELTCVDALLAVLGLSAAGLFVLNAMNSGTSCFCGRMTPLADPSERLASSVMRQVQFQLRNSKDVAAVLGDGVRLADNWWGESWCGLYDRPSLDFGV